MKNYGKASGWADGRAYSDTPFKPSAEEYLE